MSLGLTLRSRMPINVPIIGPEQDIPLMRALTLSAAARYEDLGFDHALAPKLGLRWQVDRATGMSRQFATGLRNPNGLAFRPGTGMLFVFPDASPRSFWMKGMRFCLDIIWIEDGIIAAGDDIDHASDHRFMGVWRFPDQQACKALLAGIKASGWYEYFDHVNAAGAEGGFAQHLAELAKASQLV